MNITLVVAPNVLDLRPARSNNAVVELGGNVNLLVDKTRMSDLAVMIPDDLLDALLGLDAGILGTCYPNLYVLDFANLRGVWLPVGWGDRNLDIEIGLDSTDGGAARTYNFR